ncbi:MAG: hypothetical protein ACP5U2_00815 [Bryobacteraceae bacterium]
MLRRRLVLGSWAPLLAARQEKAKGVGKRSHGAPAKPGVVIFNESDRQILREWARSFGPALPPGLARRGGDLPPGLEKQLVRKGQLPPGLEKRLVPLPVEVERRLSPLAPELRRAVIAGRVIIYHPRTRAILDVFIPLE